MSVDATYTGLLTKRSMLLKRFRNMARADTVEMPKRAYKRFRNEQILAVNSTRARYLELKREHLHKP